MKLLICLMMLLSCGCFADKSPPVPKYKKTDHVGYKVPEFYSLVCSGEGDVIDYKWQGLTPSGFIYTIQTPMDEQNCPMELTIHEVDILVLKPRKPIHDRP